jgi:hypothetical protein
VLTLEALAASILQGSVISRLSWFQTIVSG